MFSPSDSPAQHPTLSPARRFACLRVSGDDAATFLHGQLTADVMSLPAGHWVWAGYCTAQGRLLATLRLGRVADGFRLWVPAALAETLVTRLRRFVLRARVRIEAPAEGDVCVQVWGLGQGSVLEGLDHIPAEGTVTAGPAGTAFGADGALTLFTAAGSIPAAVEAVADRGWAADVAAGSPWILPETAEAFVPQMVALERIGGVSFHKGCYPGQEIVARSQYLGEVRRRPYRARLQPGPAPDPGAPVLDEKGEAAGTVLLGAEGAEPAALLVLDIRRANSDRLALADGRVFGPPEALATGEVESSPAAPAGPA